MDSIYVKSTLIIMNCRYRVLTHVFDESATGQGS